MLEEIKKANQSTGTSTMPARAPLRGKRRNAETSAQRPASSQLATFSQKKYFDDGMAFDRGQDYDQSAKDYDKTASDYDVSAQDYDLAIRPYDQKLTKEDAFEKHQLGEHADATLSRMENTPTEESALAIPHHRLVNQLRNPQTARTAFVLGEILSKLKSKA